MPLDYSKWDKICQDMSDSESSDDELGRLGPQVTKLNGKTKVTFGGQNMSSTRNFREHLESQTSTEKPKSKKRRASKDDNATNQTSSTKYPSISDLSKNGQAVSKSDEKENTGYTYMWQQDKERAVLTIPLPPKTRAKQICVKYNAQEKHLVITKTELDGTQPVTLIEGALQYDIIPESDTGTGVVVDWELLDWLDDKRRLQLVFVKSSPDGVVLWWTKLLVTEDGIDVSKIEGRNTSSTDAWAEAHRLFKEKMKLKKEPMEIDPQVDFVDHRAEMGSRVLGAAREAASKIQPPPMELDEKEIKETHS